METGRTTQEQPKPTRPLQFSLRQLLGLFVAASALLALVVHLKHVGFVVFCFSAGTLLGWRLRRWHVFLASLSALLVFAITYLACWATLGQAYSMSRWPSLHTRLRLRQIQQVLCKYAKMKGEFPDSLGELAAVKDHGLPLDSSGQILDGWHYPFHYRKTADGFELASLGRDGKIGGVGLDADAFLGDQSYDPNMRLPLRQFLFETEGSGALFNVALIASLAAGAIWCGAPKDRRLPMRRLIAGVAATTTLAILVAVFLAILYVQGVQSGH